MLAQTCGGRTVEIAPVPHRATRSEWRRLAAGVAILVPLVLLVLLPSVLGLDRYVVTDDGDGTGRWAGARSCWPGRCRPPTSSAATSSPSALPDTDDEQATREITAIDGETAFADGDVPGRADGYRVPLDRSSYARVFVGVPWIGYPFVLDFGWILLVGVALVALVLGIAAGRRAPVRRSRQGQSRPTREMAVR